MKAVSNKGLEYESLPPALQRKLFSNVERLRLAQGDRYDVLDYKHSLARVPRRLPFCAPQKTRPYPANAVNSLNRNRKRRSHSSSFLGTPQKLRKPDSIQLAYLAVQADSRCFHSLPFKLQQKLFSKEEQTGFHQTQFKGEPFDPPAKILLHRSEKARYYRRQSSETQLSGRTPVPTSQSSTLYLDPSDSDSSLAADMDESLYDSFRWLDEDGNLDLSLDEYHAHVAVSTSSLPLVRRPSFRRVASSNPCILTRKSTSSASREKTQALRQASRFPTSPVDVISHGSTPWPSSQSQVNTPQPSTSSVDPSAQYYQDPEARLKLRIYLASPQNFDEAIEFGFPALNDKKILSSKRTSADIRTSSQVFSGTFLDDDDTSAFGERSEKLSNVSRLSYVVQDACSADLAFPEKGRQSWLLPPKPTTQQYPGNREMTLKMTLTRPDLRTGVSPPATEPPRVAELPPEDSGYQVWGSNVDDEQGLMRKMWRKFRKQKS